MRRTFIPQESPEAKENRKLKDELYSARTFIIEMVAPEFERVLSSYYNFEKENAYDWLGSITEIIIEMAEAKAQVPDDAQIWQEFRAPCPLCCRGVQFPGEPGFKLPEGLRRHLMGSHNSQQCFVTETAKALAREYFGRRKEFPTPQVQT